MALHGFNLVERGHFWRCLFVV